MTTFKSIKIKGTVYDFAHLEPITLDVTIGQGDKAETFRVLVNFGCHCFTTTYDAAVHTPDYRYTHGSELRAFCPERYAYSKGLPDILNGIGNKKVFFTWENNFLHVELIVEEGQSIQYAIFFDLKRGTKGKAHVIMTVVSAYEKPELTDRLSAIKFHTLVAKTARGEKISIPNPTTRKRK
ncbi:MAG: hypothetical protein AB7U75_07275 [Hyphomicrobiaceae bacterium]